MNLINYADFEPLPMVSKFMPYATIPQGTSVNNLLRIGYNFDRFLINDDTNAAIAVLVKGSICVVVYPDNYHDVRKDRSFAIVKEF